MIEKEKEEAIKKALLEGKTISYIRKELHSSYPTIRQIQQNLIDEGILKGKRIIDDKLELEMCEKYKLGIPNKDILTEYKISSSTLSKILNKHKIERKVKSKNFDKFYDLDNPETQYWLGFLCADGCINYSIRESGCNTYSIQLTSKDEEVVNKYKNYFGEYVNIYKNTTCFNAVIGSKELCEYFINDLNITPRKSLSLNPKIEFTSDFIRGYFDGDGFVSSNKFNYRASFTSASEIFIKKIQNILEENNIYTRLEVHKHIPNDYFTLEIERKDALKSLYYFMYQNAKVCLTRKLKNFVSFFGNIENSKVGELLEQQENQQPSFGLTTDEGSTTNS